MEDTELRVVIGKVEVKRMAGGYGLFDTHTGERLRHCKRQVWVRQIDALKAAKLMSVQKTPRSDW